MGEVIKLGPFLIKWDWVLILGSALCGYFLVRWHLRQTKEIKNAILDSLGNTVLIGIGTWKLSLILLNPVSVWNNPAVLLYFSGGYRGWILALLVGFAYLLYQTKKQNIAISIYMQSYGLGFAVAHFVYHLMLFVMNPAHEILHLAQLMLSVIFIRWFYGRESSGSHSFEGWVWFGIGQIFLGFFKAGHTAVLLGLSRDQLIFLTVTLIGLLGSIKWRNFKES